MTGPAGAETVQLYAAGSLKAALTDVSKAYETSTGTMVEAKYGPSGLLKDEIAGGAEADVFASANMEHPRELQDKRKSGPVVRFARNSLCALVRPGLAADSTTLLAQMLDQGRLIRGANLGQSNLLVDENGHNRTCLSLRASGRATSPADDGGKSPSGTPQPGAGFGEPAPPTSRPTGREPWCPVRLRHG